MGNRGVLHDADRNIVSRSKLDRWILCLLDFKGRRRPLMAPGRYTELFFLDEATGLSAGHRPCAECRRERYNAFLQAWTAAHPGFSGGAEAMDRQLKMERTPEARPLVEDLHSLPSGVLVQDPQTRDCHLVHAGRLYPWTFEGYGEGVRLGQTTSPFRLLTPVGTVQAIRRGYQPDLHPSLKV